MNKYYDSLNRLFDGLPKEYKILGTAICDYNLLKELVDKSIPKKLEEYMMIYSNEIYGKCDCGDEIIHDWKFCPYCGQAIEWSK